MKNENGSHRPEHHTRVKQQFIRVRVRGKLTWRLRCWNSFNRQNVTFNKTSEIHVFKSWFSSLHLMYYFKHGSQQVYFSLILFVHRIWHIPLLDEVNIFIITDLYSCRTTSELWTLSRLQTYSSRYFTTKSLVCVSFLLPNDFWPVIKSKAWITFYNRVLTHQRNQETFVPPWRDAGWKPDDHIHLPNQTKLDQTSSEWVQLQERRVKLQPADAPHTDREFN